MQRRVHFIVLACLVAMGAFLQRCGSPPPTMPVPATGSIRILAMDTASIRFIWFNLDDVPYGKHPNPYVVEGVIVGIHKLLVFDEQNGGTSTMVEVAETRQAEVRTTLLSEGPYVGKIAPDFSASTIDNQSLALSGMKGKVVMLAFFEHT